MEHTEGVNFKTGTRGGPSGDHDASSMHESLGGNLYKLLIKNVSKNQPLTPEEAQVRIMLFYAIELLISIDCRYSCLYRN